MAPSEGKPSTNFLYQVRQLNKHHLETNALKVLEANKKCVHFAVIRQISWFTARICSNSAKNILKASNNLKLM